jgi:hypothetical protein
MGGQNWSRCDQGVSEGVRSLMLSKVVVIDTFTDKILRNRGAVVCCSPLPPPPPHTPDGAWGMRTQR